MSRFHNLSKELVSAYKAKDIHKTKVLSHEYLNLAAQNKCDWNYSNAIHQVHIISGLIALDNNDISSAKEHLITSILVPGSPQLKSFGPNMALAKELLKKGEKEIVLQYLSLSKKNWSAIPRCFYTIKWVRAIKKGQIPDFKGNLSYYIS